MYCEDFKLKIQMLSTYRNLLMGLVAIGVFVMRFSFYIST